MANATTTLLEGIKSHKLEVPNSITITNACYGVMFGFIFILFSQGKLGPLELFLTSSKSSHELNEGNVKIEVRERERDRDDQRRDGGERGKGLGNERTCLGRAERRRHSTKGRAIRVYRKANNVPGGLYSVARRSIPVHMYPTDARGEGIRSFEGIARGNLLRETLEGKVTTATRRWDEDLRRVFLVK